MSRRKPRIKGTPSTRSFQKPECKNGHSGGSILRVHGRWICAECLTVEESGVRTAPGSEVVLPANVKSVEPEAQPKTLSIWDVFPNRRYRRASKAM